MIPVQAKEFAARVVSRSRFPVVVNSFGRSGSTVLFESIARAAPRTPGKLGLKVVRDAAWSLDQDRLRPGRIYKSHDYPSESMRADCRVLYVFGNPFDATLSVIERAERDGQVWLDEHASHLRVPRFKPRDLLQRDALRVGDHLRAWLGQNTVSVGFVRYEAMWQHESNISEYLGFPVKLPARQARTDRGRLETPDFLRAYQDADELVNSLPDWIVR